MRLNAICGLVGSCALGLLSACAMEAGSDGDMLEVEGGGGEPIGVVKQAALTCDPNVYDQCGNEDTDSTGTLFTRIFYCKPVNSSRAANGEFAGAVCPVTSDYALVGGGAAASNGALLIGSFPATDAWVGISREHVEPAPHQLSTYAVGLRIKNRTAAQVRPLVKLTTADSGTAAHPSVAAFIPADHVLLGGGAFALESGDRQLLTHSFPLPPSNGGWVVASKDHVVSAPGVVRAYALSMPKRPLTGVVCLKNKPVEVAWGPSVTHYSTVFKPHTDPGAIITGVGAASDSSDRLLTGMVPLAGGGGVVAMNKDHVYVDVGSVGVYPVAIAAASCL